MSDIPKWIDERIDRNLNNTLTQEHVVETMIESDRLFFSIRQLKARVKPDVGKATVRNRLNELQKIDVVATETYPESITLYYINHPESNWPLSPEGKAALSSDTPLDRLSTRGFLTMQDTAGIRTLVLAGFQWALVLSVVGNAISLFSLHRECLSGDSSSFVYLLTGVTSSFYLFPDTVLRAVSPGVRRSRIGSATRPNGLTEEERKDFFDCIGTVPGEKTLTDLSDEPLCSPSATCTKCGIGVSGYQ